MSGKARKRMVVLTEVKRGKLSVAAAGRLFGVCYRQAKRLWRRFKNKGEAGLATVAEQLAGQEPQTQFGLAMEQLGVEVIMAHSPQAKGRVERRHGLLQDRLVKELRLAGVSDLATANEFLEQKFLPALNQRFTLAARSSVDAHRQGAWNLGEVLSWEETRVVAKDWTVAWANRWFQIAAEHERLSLAGRKVMVRHLRCGTVQLLDNGVKLRWKELPARPPNVTAPRRVGRIPLSKPGQTQSPLGQSISQPLGYGRRRRHVPRYLDALDFCPGWHVRFRHRDGRSRLSNFERASCPQ